MPINTYSKIVSTPAIGASVAGECAFGESPGSFAVSYNVRDGDGLGRPVTQFGRRQFANRANLVPYYLPVSIPSSISGGGVVIEISTAKGSFLGSIRNDVRQTMLSDLQFTIDTKGCADGVINLNDLPSFPLPPFSIVTIRQKGASFNWYKGQLDYTDLKTIRGASNGKYQFKIFSLRKILSDKKAETIYSAPMDVGLIVDDLAKNWIAPYTPISYNSAKIQTFTGVFSSVDMDFSKAPIASILDTLATMAGCDWGVDGDGDLFFLAKVTAVKKVYFVGYRTQSFEPKLNVQAVKNSILVKRQFGKSSGAAGWEVAYITHDDTSQAKYGELEMEVQVPGLLGDDVCAILGDKILEENKEPRYSADVKKIIISSEKDYIVRGKSRFILPFGRHSEVLNECDDVSQFTIFGSGDLSKSLDTSNLETGYGSIRFDYTVAASQYAEVALNYSANMKKLRFWFKGSKAGAIATVGIGVSSWSEHTKPITVIVPNKFFLFEWDFEKDGLSISQINTLAIRVDDAGAGQFYIDEISVEQLGHKWYDLGFSRAVYKFQPKDSSVDAEFGPIPPKTESFVSKALAAATELKFVSEKR